MKISSPQHKCPEGPRSWKKPMTQPNLGWSEHVTAADYECNRLKQSLEPTSEWGAASWEACPCEDRPRRQTADHFSWNPPSDPHMCELHSSSDWRFSDTAEKVNWVARAHPLKHKGRFWSQHHPCVSIKNCVTLTGRVHRQGMNVEVNTNSNTASRNTNLRSSNGGPLSPSRTTARSHGSQQQKSPHALHKTADQRMLTGRQVAKPEQQ